MTMDSKANVPKYISVLLILTVTALSFSCAAKSGNRMMLDKSEISEKSKESDKPYKIQRSINAYLKDGGHVFYKFEMKVAQDTIISRGLKYDAAGGDTFYIEKIPVSDVDRFESVIDRNEMIFAIQVMTGILGVIYVFGIVIQAMGPKAVFGG